MSDDHRQKAKQLCYGIIYGMGARGLADQLEIEESEATNLMETFHLAFPGVFKTRLLSCMEDKTKRRCRSLFC